MVSTSQTSKEKPVVEKLVIDAYLLTLPNDIYDKLSLLLREIKTLIHNGESLNRNILDKLRRISERNYLHINLLISRIVEKLIESQEQVEFLSDDIDLLIGVSNFILNLFEGVKSNTTEQKSLEKKNVDLLRYIHKLKVSESQKAQIDEILQSIPKRNHSQVFSNFQSVLANILSLISSEKYQDVEQGIHLLIESFGNTNSLEEQFEIMKYLYSITDLLVNRTVGLEDFKDLLSQYANFLCSLIFPTNYQIEANTEGYNINEFELKENKLFIFKDNTLITQFTANHLSSLQGCVYELTSQKELLLSCEGICNMVVKLVNHLIQFKSCFNLQFLSFLLVKRIYFTFPKFIIFIEDILIQVCINLCHFKHDNEEDQLAEPKAFLSFLLSDQGPNGSIKEKAKAAVSKLKFDPSKYVFEGVDFQLETLFLNNFNLRVGSPYSLEIDASSSENIILEVYYPNSIIYVAFAVEFKDISFEIFKYQQNDHFDSVHQQDLNESEDKKFKSFFRVDYLTHSSHPVKFILVVFEPGLYKLVWDNNYSWFTKKKIRYRVSVLRPLESEPSHKPVRKISIVKQNKIHNLLFEGNSVDIDIKLIKNKIRTVEELKNVYRIVSMVIFSDRIITFDIENQDFTVTKFEEGQCDSVIEEIINREDHPMQLSEITMVNSLYCVKTPPVDLEKFSFDRESVKTFSAHFVCACLAYDIYLKILNKQPIKDTLFIVFENNLPYIALNIQGNINHNVKSIAVDQKRGVLENSSVLINYILHLSAVFKDIEVIFASFDLKKQVIEELSKVVIDGILQKGKGKIQIEIREPPFLLETMRYIQLIIS